MGSNYPHDCGDFVPHGSPDPRSSLQPNHEQFFLEFCSTSLGDEARRLIANTHKRISSPYGRLFISNLSIRSIRIGPMPIPPEDFRRGRSSKFLPCPVERKVTNYSSDCNNDKQQSFDDELREISGSRRLGILNNRTRFDLALESPNPPTIYTCGDNSKEYFEVIGGIFDEYKTNGKFLDETPWYDANGVRGLSQVESTDYDLFVTTYQVQCSSDATTWLTNKFKGQFIYMSGESQNYPFEGGSIASGNPKYHVFGPIDAETEFDYPITYMQTTWLNTFQKMLGPDVMMTGNSRPNGKSIYIFKNDSFVSNPDGGRYFLVYGQNNCVKYRDEALRNFAELDIGDVHQAGKCGPPIWTKNVIKLGKPRISIYNWRNNVKFFANFRFCLVLEHAHPHKYP
ncbi:hypothetical protein THAOC_17169, partial [Thalassiosira oceanica]